MYGIDTGHVQEMFSQHKFSSYMELDIHYSTTAIHILGSVDKTRYPLIFTVIEYKLDDHW